MTMRGPRRVRVVVRWIASALCVVSCLVAVELSHTAPAWSDQESWVPSQAPLPTSLLPDGDPATAMQLWATSCASTTFCVAVGLVTSQPDYVDAGYNPSFPLAEIYNGSTWTPQVLPVPANAQGGQIATAVLYAVSCAVNGACAAAGVYVTTEFGADTAGQVGLLEQLSNGVWTATPADGVPGGNPNSTVLDSVSCSDATTCVAVGDEGSDNGPVAAIFELDGSTWNPVGAPIPPGGTIDFLNGVSCPIDGICTIVGWYENADLDAWGLIINLESGVWVAQTAPLPANIAQPPHEVVPNIQLDAVDCPEEGSCVVGGGYNDNSQQYQPLLMTLANGTWTVTVPPLPSDAASSDAIGIVNGVFCPALGSCVATGTYFTDYLAGDQSGMLLSQSGDEWTATSAPLPSAPPVDNVPIADAVGGRSDAASSSIMAGVSCGEGGFCAAVGNDGAVGVLESSTLSGLPEVTSITPASGSVRGGTHVTIDGNNFTAGSTVSFGGHVATVIRSSPTQILVVSPAVSHAQPVDVTVTSDKLVTRANPSDVFSYFDASEHVAGFTAQPARTASHAEHVGFVIPTARCGRVPNYQGFQSVFEGVQFDGSRGDTVGGVTVSCGPTPEYTATIEVNGSPVKTELVANPGEGVTVTVTIGATASTVRITIGRHSQTTTSTGGTVSREYAGALATGCTTTSTCNPVPEVTSTTFTNLTFDGGSPVSRGAAKGNLEDAAGHAELTTTQIRTSAFKVTWDMSCSTGAYC